ncbi:MAG: rhodanese-like domain-containing protein [Actinomycetota bacterium]
MTTLPPTDNVTVQQTLDLVREDPLVRIIDVRTGGEFETMHIPGSFNVPLDTLDEHARDLADLEHPIVLVCQSGNRASTAHGALTGAGKDRLHLLEGGIAAWEAAGADVVRGDTERWAMDRQVRLVAGSLALAGVLASLVAPRAKWLSAGVASGLVYSAVSDTCAMANVLGKLPYNRVGACDIASVLDEIRGAPSATAA